METGLKGNRLSGRKARDKDGHGTHTAATICGGKVDGMAIACKLTPDQTYIILFHSIPCVI